MDFKVNREALSVSEGVYDGVSEQAVELDYILPDYYPDIFKVLKCQLTPTVVSYNTSSDKLTYDAVALIRVLYISGPGGALKSVEQRYAYSKTLDFSKSCENPVVMLRPKTDYVNCRAVNQRRLDIRGSVSCKVKATATRQQPLISDAEGLGLQVKKEAFPGGGQRLNTYKQFTVREEVDVGNGKPDAVGILRYDTTAQVSDYKVIANKVIAKGMVALTVLYSCGENGEGGIEPLQANIPISQILDVDGVNDTYDCFITFDVISADLNIKHDEAGDNRLVSVDLVVGANCVANRDRDIQLVTDVYSTNYAVDFGMASVKVESTPRAVNENFVRKSGVENSEGPIDGIYDVWANVSNASARYQGPNELLISGSLNISVLAKTADGGATCLERSEIIDQTLNVEGIKENSVFEPDIRVASVGYNLASANGVEVRAEIAVRGSLTDTKNVVAVSEINVDTSRPKSKEDAFALKLYYADKGEDVWDIAKRYSTSVGAIMEENELPKDVLEQRGMLLIPMA